MNIIANNVASKLFVAFVAASMLFTLATPAKAATVEELQAMIAQLTAQIAALSGGSSAPAAGCTFTRALTVGSEGADVKCLQDYLTPTYFSNAGGSTGYFGPVTAAAVAAWQSANGVMPAAGYFGPVSQAKYNALMAAAGPVTGGGSSSDDEDDSSTGGLSGEASLNNMEIDSASDDEVDEGQEDAEVAVATFEFADGDAEITRIDVAFDKSGTDVWDVLDEVSLWVDGDEIARTSASDEDDYQDEDTGTLRFSGLDLVAMEDEEVEVTIAATFQNNVDTLDQGTYNVSVDSFRWVDAEGVTETENSGEDLDTNVTFTLGAQGQDDEITVKTSSEDPNGTTLQVEDTAKSDWYTVFAFDLDTDDSENDITLNEFSLIVDTASSSGSASALNYGHLVDDMELVIDGVVVDTFASGTATTTAAGFDFSNVFAFDVDGDVTIDAGDRVTAELKMKFKSLASANEGATVRARVNSENAKAIDAEGADDIPAARLSGAATGDTHTLRTEGIVLDLTSISATEGTKTISNTSYDYGIYVFTFTVESFNGDFYMDEDAAIVDYDLLVDGVAAVAASTTATLDITGSGAEDAAVADKVINEGGKATFTLRIETTTSVDGSSKVVLNSVAYSAADDATEELTAIATPASEWTSDSLIIN